MYLCEDYLTARINSWVARLFNPAHVDLTVDALADADELVLSIETQAQSFRRRITAARSRSSGCRGRSKPVGIVRHSPRYNAAVAEKRAAEAGLAAIDPVAQLSAAALNHANRDELAQLYDALGLAVTYDHRGQVTELSITPALHGVGMCVRGGHAP